MIEDNKNFVIVLVAKCEFDTIDNYEMIGKRCKLSNDKIYVFIEDIASCYEIINHIKNKNYTISSIKNTKIFKHSVNNFLDLIVLLKAELQ